MTKSKHTPGPWTITQRRKSRSNVWWINAGDRAIASTVASHLGMPALPPWEVTANAALIAAGPELLAACEEASVFVDDELSDWPEGGNPHGEYVIAKLRAAIAKAKGA